jgi:Zn-finger nucleic acid-binding protein
MRQCPRCNVPFESQRRTFAEIDTCPQCGGTFLDPGEGVTALGHRDDLRAVVDRGDGQLVGGSTMACPSGHGGMTLYRFGDAERKVEIDVCNVCGGSFFDAGETEIIADIQARAGEVARSSFASPPGARSAQDAAIDAARREGGKSAFASFFSSLVGGLGAAAASAGRGHHHHGLGHHHHGGVDKGGGFDKSPGKKK